MAPTKAHVLYNGSIINGTVLLSIGMVRICKAGRDKVADRTR
jgi:hypothetical protein